MDVLMGLCIHVKGTYFTLHVTLICCALHGCYHFLTGVGHIGPLPAVGKVSSMRSGTNVSTKCALCIWRMHVSYVNKRVLIVKTILCWFLLIARRRDIDKVMVDESHMCSNLQSTRAEDRSSICKFSLKTPLCPSCTFTHGFVWNLKELERGKDVDVCV